MLAGTHRERQGDGAGTVTSRRAAFLHRQLRTSISVQLPVCRAFSYQARAQILHATRARGVRQGAPRGCTPSPAGSGALTQRCIPALCGATALLRGRGRSTGSPPTEGLLQATGAPASLPCGPEQPSAPPPPAARPQQPPLPQLPPPQPRVGPRGRGSPPRAPRYLLGPLSALAAAAAALAPLAAVAPAGRLVAHRCPAPLRGRRRRAMGASRRRGRHPRGGAGTGTEGGDGGKGRDEEGRGGGRRGAALPGDTGRRAAGGPRREGAALRGSQRGCGAEAAGVVSEAAGRRPCPVSGRSCTNSAPPQS